MINRNIKYKFPELTNLEFDSLEKHFDNSGFSYIAKIKLTTTTSFGICYVAFLKIVTTDKIKSCTKALALIAKTNTQEIPN